MQRHSLLNLPSLNLMQLSVVKIEVPIDTDFFPRHTHRQFYY